ncbi:MAG TPA: phosphotransferase [Acidimicrobiia bacterium]|jgi:aminoglycoside phosphotransferase (APT) family kinase protein
MQRAMDATSDTERARLAAWIERTVGGRVTRIDRMPRWRPAWDVDVEVDGRLLPLHARGEREPRIAMPARIADEVAVHDLLEAHGLPVPHAYGLCDDPYALVMDRLPGLVDLAGATDGERDRVLEEYLELLARIYAIPLDAAAAAGFAVPTDSASAELAFVRRMEAVADRDAESRPADPVEVFLRRWLRDHVPQHRLPEARFITYDSFQFMFEDGRITGLLDFEHAHVGDPMMDLAALRIRDTLKSLGDLAALTARYEAVTGVVVDHDVVEYQTVLYNALSVVSVAPALADPVRGTDWISYLAWYVNGARWAFGSIAEIRGYALDPVEIPEARLTRHAPAHRYLVDSVRARSAEVRGDASDYELAGIGRLASHLKRVDEIGAQFDADELAELTNLLGHRPDPHDADAELVEYIERAGPDDEEGLVRLLDARVQRQHFTMASPTSLMLRHPALRSLRSDQATDRAADESWPTGAIPGTR